MAREKCNALIIDTETTMKNEHGQLPFHIGGVFGDIRNKFAKTLEFEFYVQEIVERADFFIHTYKDKEVNPPKRKFWKLDSRYYSEFLGRELSRKSTILQDVIKNPHKVKPIAEILGYLEAYIDMADCIGSYNWFFDRDALKRVSARFNHHDFRAIEKAKAFCLMHCYSDKVINRNYFRMIDNLDEVDKSHFMSKSGKNLGYSCEVMARYCLDDISYKEDHTALKDARIEYALATKFANEYWNDLSTSYIGNPKRVKWQDIRDRLTAKEKLASTQLSLPNPSKSELQKIIMEKEEKSVPQSQEEFDFSPDT